MRVIERLPRDASAAIIQFQPQLQVACLLPESNKKIKASWVDPQGVQIPKTIWVSQIGEFHGSKMVEGIMNHRYFVYVISDKSKPGSIVGAPAGFGNNNGLNICWGENPAPTDLRSAINQFFSSSFGSRESMEDWQIVATPTRDWNVLLEGPENNWAESLAYLREVYCLPAKDFVKVSLELIDKAKAKVLAHFAKASQKNKDIVINIIEHGKPITNKDVGPNKLISQEFVDQYSLEHLGLNFKGKPSGKANKFSPPEHKFKNISDVIFGQANLPIQGPIDSIFLSDEKTDIEAAGGSVICNQETPSKYRVKKDIAIAVGHAVLSGSSYKITLLPSQAVIVANSTQAFANRPQGKGTSYIGYTSPNHW